MHEFWTTILTAVGFSSAATLVIGWLLRTWISERLKNAIKHEYDQKLAAYQAELKAESDVEIENLKTRLQIAAAERSVQYTHVYSKTAETVADVYSRLLDVHDAVAQYTKSVEYETDPPKEERRIAVGKSVEAFQKYYRPLRLYIPRASDDRIAEFINGLYNISIQFRKGVEEGWDYRPESNPDENTWAKAHKYMTEEVPPVLRSLEAEFRTLLGFVDESKPAQSG